MRRRRRSARVESRLRQAQRMCTERARMRFASGKEKRDVLVSRRAPPVQRANPPPSCNDAERTLRVAGCDAKSHWRVRACVSVRACRRVCVRACVRARVCVRARA
eukprot:6180828-Pleurochrysis_carterae.AAC.1